MLSIVLAAARGRILFSHPIYYPMSFYWGMGVLVLWDINEQCLLIPAISLFWCRFIPSPLICWHNIIYSLCFHRCGQPFQDEVFFLEPFDELDSKVCYSVRWTIINKERWEDFFCTLSCHTGILKWLSTSMIIGLQIEWQRRETLILIKVEMSFYLGRSNGQGSLNKTFI